MTGDVKERWPTSEGTYTLGPSLLNRQPYWIKKDEGQAIWYDKLRGNWKMGSKTYLWTNTGRMVTNAGSAHFGEYLPHRVTPWKYIPSDASRDTPWTASSEIQVQNTGKLEIANLKY